VSPPGRNNVNSWSDSDVRCMRLALEEARHAAGQGEIPVGAVLVKNGAVVARGRNRSIGDSDPTAHAEIVVLREAAVGEGNYRLAGTELFVTLEPCAMCMGAMLQARISRLVFGAYDDKAGAAGSVIDLANFRGLNHRIEVNGGLLQEDCGAVLQEFFAYRR
jgi:tRNA(Arg) A34 adenosine deaminase TadA